MASINKVILVGHLGRDPELRTFPSGDTVANVTIATTDKWKDKQTGEAKELTEWNRVVFNGKLADIVGQYLRKGALVYVEGSLRTRSWEKDGVKQYATEIRADTMQMLSSLKDGGGGQQQGGRDQGGYQQAPQQQQQQAPQQQRQTPQQQQGQQQQVNYQAPQGQNFGAGQQQQQQRPPQQGNATGGYSNSHSVPPQGTSSGFNSMDDDIPF